MKELQLKYGCNPNQASARVYMKDGSDLPFDVLNGRPGYINLLDAFNSYQLVKELKEATEPCGSSFFQTRQPRRCSRSDGHERYPEENLLGR